MAVRGGMAMASFLVLGLWGDSGTMGADSAAHIARGRYAVMPGNGAGGARRALLEVRYKQREIIIGEGGEGIPRGNPWGDHMGEGGSPLGVSPRGIPWGDPPPGDPPWDPNGLRRRASPRDALCDHAAV